MKNIGLLFLIAFVFFFIGQVLWTIGIIMDSPLFGSKEAEDWIVNIVFTLCSIFGLIGSFRLYSLK